MNAADTEIIDPLSWISAERQLVTTFVTTSTQAADDLAGSIADFQNEIKAEADAETQFTNELASLSAAVNPASIAQTLQDLSSSDSAITASFSQLQSSILQNNQAATSLAQKVASVSDSVQQIEQTRTTLQGKIASYRGVLGTFRTFGKNKPQTPATSN